MLERMHTLLEGPRIGPDGELVYSDVIAGGLFSCSPAGVVDRAAAGPSRHRRHPRPRRRRLGHQRQDHPAPGARRLRSGSCSATGRRLRLQRHLQRRPPGTCSPASCATGRWRGSRRSRGGCCGSDGEASCRSSRELVTWPNGIGVSPDGESVYVSDYVQRRGARRPARRRGRARSCADAPRGSADGLAVDADGGIWVALGEGGRGSRASDDAGSLQEVIDVPAQLRLEHHLRRRPTCAMC